MASSFNPLASLKGGFSFGGSLGSILVTVVMALGALFICGLIIWMIYRWKSWNLKVEFKLPRSTKYYPDSKGHIDVNNVTGFVDSEWGRGNYNSKTGVVWLKRKGKSRVAMKPFNLAKYLQGKNLLTVVQVSSTDYIPVIPESFMIFEDEQGREASLLNLKADTSESKAWKSSFERDSKNAYSIMGLIKEYLPLIGLGLVILLWGIQIIIVKKNACG